jgi:hypothetical protein
MTQPIRLDEQAVPRDSTRWQRADPRAAVLARAGWDEWVVYLPDGDTSHVVQLHEEGDAYAGTCDCQGFEYDGVCAHLCTVAKAATVDHPDASGRPVEIDSVADRFSGDVDDALRADGRGEEI